MIRLFKVFLFIIFIAPLLSYSQSVGLQQETNVFTENVDLYNNNNIYQYKIPDEYQGTPYYHNSFLLGNVYMNGKLIENNVSLRYNVFADELEYKKSGEQGDKQTFAIIKSEDIYVTINNETIIFKATKGYFLVVFDGTNFSLLKKLKKKYYPFKKATTSLTTDVPAIFMDEESYFISTKDGVLKEFTGSKNKKLKVFSTKYNQAKSYIKEKKLDINKEKDLKRLIMYLDNLNSSEL